MLLGVEVGRKRLGTIVLHWFAGTIGDNRFTLLGSNDWGQSFYTVYSLAIVTRMFLNIGVRDFGSTTRGTSTLDSG